LKHVQQHNPRIDRLGEYAFTKLNQLLAPLQPRANTTPIVMSVGDPMHPVPPFVAEVIAKNAPLWNRYPTMMGTQGYRDAVAAWLTRRYSLPAGMISADRHILPLAGTKEGLFLVAQVAVPETKAGKPPLCLLPNPYYNVYSGGGVMAGAEPHYLDATKATGFLPDLDVIPEDVLARAAIFYLCSPANPQGAIASLDYFKKAIGLARQYDFLLVVDECYAEIYDKAPPPGGLEACAKLGADFANVVVFHSLSKRSSAAGMRMGFIAGDADVIKRFAEIRSYGGCQVPLPIQEAATALWREETHVTENRALYVSKVDTAERVLKGKFGFYRPPGGFFLWLDVGDGEKATLKLWQEAGVRTLPGGYLGRINERGVNPSAQYIRVALVHDDATIADGLERMVRVLGG
jgi:aspartate/methionine/tyrosine aminotransferase